MSTLNFSLAGVKRSLTVILNQIFCLGLVPCLWETSTRNQFLAKVLDNNRLKKAYFAVYKSLITPARTYG